MMNIFFFLARGIDSLETKPVSELFVRLNLFGVPTFKIYLFYKISLNIQKLTSLINRM